MSEDALICPFSDIGDCEHGGPFAKPSALLSHLRWAHGLNKEEARQTIQRYHARKRRQAAVRRENEEMRRIADELRRRQATEAHCSVCGGFSIVNRRCVNCDIVVLPHRGGKCRCHNPEGSRQCGGCGIRLLTTEEAVAAKLGRKLSRMVSMHVDLYRWSKHKLSKEGLALFTHLDLTNREMSRHRGAENMRPARLQTLLNHAMVLAHAMGSGALYEPVVVFSQAEDEILCPRCLREFDVTFDEEAVRFRSCSRCKLIARKKGNEWTLESWQYAHQHLADSSGTADSGFLAG